MAAWVSREYRDDGGKLRREKLQPGVRGVKDSDRFIVFWVDPDGRLRQERIRGERGKPMKKLADQRAQQVTAQLTMGTYEDRATATWEGFIKRYKEEELPNKRSQETRDEIVKSINLFTKYCNPTKVSSVTDAMIDRFITRRRKDQAPAGKGPEGEKLTKPITNATINKDLRHLRPVFKKAVRWKLLKQLPMIELLPEFKKQKPLVRDDEFIAMLEACKVATYPMDLPFSPPDFWRALLVTAFGTGQRIGALLSLRWDQVDLDRRRWLGQAEDLKGKRDQTVHFGDDVAAYLGKIRQLAAPNVFVWPHSMTRLYDQLRAIQAAAGLDPNRPDFKFHATRRSFVTYNWDLLGPDEVQRRAGHKSRATTEAYRGYVEEQRDEVKAAFMPAAVLQMVGG